jgi:hypothetical protein
MVRLCRPCHWLSERRSGLIERHLWRKHLHRYSGGMKRDMLIFYVGQFLPAKRPQRRAVEMDILGRWSSDRGRRSHCRRCSVYQPRRLHIGSIAREAYAAALGRASPQIGMSSQSTGKPIMAATFACRRCGPSFLTRWRICLAHLLVSLMQLSRYLIITR